MKGVKVGDEGNDRYGILARIVKELNDPTLSTIKQMFVWVLSTL